MYSRLNARHELRATLDGEVTMKTLPAVDSAGKRLTRTTVPDSHDASQTESSLWKVSPTYHDSTRGTVSYFSLVYSLMTYKETQTRESRCTSPEVLPLHPHKC